MTSSRKIAVIAVAILLFATPLLAVVKCVNGTETCARVSERPLRDPICPRAADSQEPGTDAACRACGHSLLPFVGKMSADNPIEPQTVGITMTASADDTTKSLTDAFLVQAWPRLSGQLLLHCALLL